jgi:hypothetical protein
MAGNIFINYRRGDDPGFTQALYQRLEEEFPATRLFMDIEGHIKPGDNFVAVLNSQVAACDLLLAVIGPRWADLLSARAGGPEDFVVVEISAALDQGKRVIPVLVGGAAMPRPDTLPEPIRALAHRSAVALRPDRFRADCRGFIATLKEHLASAERDRRRAERATAEVQRQARQAETATPMAERARAIGIMLLLSVGIGFAVAGALLIIIRTNWPVAERAKIVGVRHLKCTMHDGTMAGLTYSFSMDTAKRTAAWADYGIQLSVGHLDEQRLHTTANMQISGWPAHTQVGFNFNRLTLRVEGALTREPSDKEVTDCRAQAKGPWLDYCEHRLVVGELSHGSCEELARAL